MRTRQVLDALGDGNAENERHFEDVFVETHDYLAVAGKSRSLVLGGRGTGKSAIFRMLARQSGQTSAAAGRRSLVVKLEADPSSWRELEHTADVENDDVAAISRQWELAILLHCFEVTLATFPALAKRRKLVRDLNAEVEKLLDRDLLRENPQGRMSMVLSAAATMLRRLPFKFQI
jgi:hypothetical protein